MDAIPTRPPCTSALVHALALFRGDARAGCSAYDVYNHAYIPAYYRDPVEEYWHLLENVTLWDVGVEHIVQIKAGRVEFTNLLTCRDLTRCAVGHASTRR